MAPAPCPRLARGAVIVAALALSGCVTTDREGDPSGASAHSLGSPPLCEPSAAARAPWDATVVLVADDDVADRLFAFDLAPGGLLSGQRALPLSPGGGPEDLEAMAVTGANVVILGSHGRSARCGPRPERERFEILARHGDSGVLSRVRLVDSEARLRDATRSVPSCLDALFVSPPPVHAEAFCAAVVEAEASLDPDRCIPPLDVEAAAAGLSRADGEPDRVWIGLRRPRLVQGGVLLRLTPELDELRFDAVCLLAAGDRGIRGLTAHQGSLWAILGPGAPSFATSALWQAAAAEVAPGAIVRGRIAADGLPPSSEAVIIDADRAIVLTDGSAAPVGTRCERAPTQVRVPLKGLLPPEPHEASAPAPPRP